MKLEANKTMEEVVENFKDLVDDRLQYVDAEIMYERHEKKQYANK